MYLQNLQIKINNNYNHQETQIKKFLHQLNYFNKHRLDSNKHLLHQLLILLQMN